MLQALVTENVVFNSIPRYDFTFIGNTGITVLEPVFAKMKLIDLPGKAFVNV